MLGNYNRINAREGASYQFQRAEKPDKEIKTWEAARATSAAPRHFKPFDHEHSGQVFLDGAIYYNCPIDIAMSERKLIWPELADATPDITISIGTSYNPKSPRKTFISNTKSRWGAYSHYKQLVKIATDHVLSSLDSEKTWKEFLNRFPSTDKFTDRYIRLNLPLDKDPPRLDNVRAMSELQEITRSRYTMRRDEVKAIADRLLATTFYFERTSDSARENENRSISITGNIVCRFAPGSEEIRALGEAFRKRSTDAYNLNYAAHEPYFMLMERRREKDAQQVSIATHTLDKMIRDGHFSMGQITLTLSDRMAESEIMLCFSDQPGRPTYYPISGFPRCLLEEERKFSSRTRLSLSLGRKRTPTQAHRGAWSLPSQSEGKLNPIERYGARDYLYPGDATSDAISEISQRFASTNQGRSDGVGSSVGSSWNVTSDSHDGYPTSIAELPTESSRLGTADRPAEMSVDSIQFPSQDRISSRPPVGTSKFEQYELG